MLQVPNAQLHGHYAPTLEACRVLFRMKCDLFTDAHSIQDFLLLRSDKECQQMFESK